MNKTPQRWFTADPQVFHNYTAELRGFASQEEHNEHIAAVWREHVREQDNVWVLGDAHLGPIEQAMAFYADLPGRKTLVLGNHDQAHPMHSRAMRMLPRYEVAFERIVSSATLKSHGVKVLLSHFPYDGDSRTDEPDRHVQWRLRDMGVPLLHGHVHSSDVVTHSEAGTLQVHLGWDAWHRPVNNDEVFQTVLEHLNTV